jgi:hypothetical protein
MYALIRYVCYMILDDLGKQIYLLYNEIAHQSIISLYTYTHLHPIKYYLCENYNMYQNPNKACLDCSTVYISKEFGYTYSISYLIKMGYGDKMHRYFKIYYCSLCFKSRCGILYDFDIK